MTKANDMQVGGDQRDDPGLGEDLHLDEAGEATVAIAEWVDPRDVQVGEDRD